MSDQAGKKWCAWCGSWGDHQSGNCIQLTRDEVNQLRKELAAVSKERDEARAVLQGPCWKTGECYYKKLMAERDQLRAQRDELELKLVALGDLAVADWDDKVVGEVDAAVKEPTRYKDRLKALFIDIPMERDQLREECERLTKDNAELDAEFKESHARAVGMCDKLREELARLKAENERLREALTGLHKTAHHATWCASGDDIGRCCTCGLAEQLNAATDALRAARKL